MGYRGKLAEQRQARHLRRSGLPLGEIATRLGVSKSSVSLWVRDVEFTPLPRPVRGRRREPNALQRRKQAEIDRLLAEGQLRVGRLSEREFLVAGVALYAGEGAKRDGAVKFANSEPRMIAFYCAAVPRGSRSEHPAHQACAWLRQHRLQLLGDPPPYHGARSRAPQ